MIRNSLPKVSIIIVNHNGLEHLKACLDSVLKTEYPNFEIIFIDNKSTDNSVKFVEKSYPSIKIIRNNENLGFGAAANLGITSSSGKYIAFLNEDVEVDRNWLTPLVECMESNRNIAVCEGKMLHFFNRKFFDSANGAGRFIDKFGNVFVRGGEEIDQGQYNKSVKTFYALTLFRRTIFQEVGLFDTKFFLYYEETDLCWRIRLKSFEIVYVPSSIIYHKGPKKGKTSSNRSYHFTRNKLMMLIKNYSLKSLICVFPILLFDLVLGFAVFFIGGDFNRVLNIIKAPFWVVINFKKIWIDHQRIQLSRITPDKEIQSIMIKYNGVLKLLLRKIAS